MTVSGRAIKTPIPATMKRSRGKSLMRVRTSFNLPAARTPTMLTSVREAMKSALAATSAAGVSGMSAWR